jgi:hypothetical protein
MWTKDARSAYSAASSPTMSVTGPQNRLTQKVGVEITRRTGRPAASACLTVVWCSSGSGTGSPPPARESMAEGSAPGVSRVRLSEAMAGSPGAGTVWAGSTLNVAVAVSGLSSSAVTATPQNPSRSKATSAA